VLFGPHVRVVLIAKKPLGVDGQQGALKASFFEEQPGTFITRRKGERVFVKAAQSADVRSK